jgi:hypothetical protein
MKAPQPFEARAHGIIKRRVRLGADQRFELAVVEP